MQWPDGEHLNLMGLELGVMPGRCRKVASHNMEGFVNLNFLTVNLFLPFASEMKSSEQNRNAVNRNV